MPPDSATPTCIGIALVERDGCYLIRQRPAAAGSPLPGYWEFPGGKREPGETAESAARRECREEAGLDVAIRGLRMVVNHAYPHGLLELSFFDATPLDRAAEPDPAAGFRWVPANDLPAYRFPEANGPVLRELAPGADPAGRP